MKHRTLRAAVVAAVIACVGLTGAWAQRGPGGATVDTSSVKTKWTDVAYATKSSAEKLDIYLPNTGSGPFPCIIVIHGGAFQIGDKNGPELASAIAGLGDGWAVVSINYRLSGEAKWPAQINDVKAAIRFLRANAAKYHLDPDRFAAWGSSAGGNLAALAGTSGGVAALQDSSLGNTGVSDAVQAVVDQYGPIDFTAMDAQFKTSGISGQVHNSASSPESALFGTIITSVPDLVKQANPTTYVTADDPPFFIQHGSADNLIPTQQSVDFAAALAKVIGKDKVTLGIIQGAGHGTAEFSTTANVKKVFAFLDSVLKK
jgi:acetyl esterase/lipase